MKIEKHNNRYIRVLPVQEENEVLAKWVVELFQMKGFHVDIDARPILVGKRIQQARKAQANMVVLVDDESQYHGLVKVKDLENEREYHSILI